MPARSPQRRLDLLDHPGLGRGVDAQRPLHDLERVAVLAGEVDDAGGVLREAGAAEAGAGEEELGPDAPVEAHPAGDVLHVGAHPLAQARDLVDEGDLQREEAVRGVLDQLGRLDVGDDEGTSRARRAESRRP